MGFKPCRADQDLWIRKRHQYKSYDYIATHIDDIICATWDTSKYISQIEQEFKIHDLNDKPDYYLGNNIKAVKNGYHVSSEKYTKEILRRYQDKYGLLRKENVPLSPKEHPELDASAYLDEKQTGE